MDIAGNIKVLRKKRGFSQAELGELVGKTESSIQKYELGVAEPPISVLSVIADKLDVALADVIGCREWHGIPGFTVLLNDYCAFCPDFEPEVEKLDSSTLCDPFRVHTNIRCQNRKKCARIAANIEEHLKNE